MRRRPSIPNRAALLALGAALLTAASLGAAAQSPGGLVPGGDTPDLLLLHTGDVIGYIEPCG